MEQNTAGGSNNNSTSLNDASSIPVIQSTPPVPAPQTQVIEPVIETVLPKIENQEQLTSNVQENSIPIPEPINPISTAPIEPVIPIVDNSTTQTQFITPEVPVPPVPTPPTYSSPTIATNKPFIFVADGGGSITQNTGINNNSLPPININVNKGIPPVPTTPPSNYTYNNSSDSKDYTNIEENQYPYLRINHIQNPSRFYAIPMLGGIFKTFALIPQFLFLYFFTIGIGVLLIVNAFIVLFTGKYMETLYQWIRNYFILITKVIAYFTGLTNHYPGFNFDFVDNEIELIIEKPEKPGRFYAIPIIGYFVKGILLIPYLIWEYILAYGMTFGCSIFASLSVLVIGKYPESIYELSRDTLKIRLRQYMYLFGLSDRYPSFKISKNHLVIKLILIFFGFILLGSLLIFNLFINNNLNNNFNYFNNRTLNLNSQSNINSLLLAFSTYQIGYHVNAPGLATLPVGNTTIGDTSWDKGIIVPNCQPFVVNSPVMCTALTATTSPLKDLLLPVTPQDIPYNLGVNTPYYYAALTNDLQHIMVISGNMRPDSTNQPVVYFQQN